MRRLITSGIVACALLAGCGAGAADDAAPTVGDDEAPAGLARRAAAQLEVETLPGADGGPFAGRELDPAMVTPDFTLTTTDGTPYDFRRDADAAVTLLYFGFASCPDVCPAHMAAISSALSRLPDAVVDDVDVLFVSVDAVNDGPEQLGDYLANFDDRFVGLTGTAAQVNAALTSTGLPPTAIADADAYPPAHPSYVLAYTDDGRGHVAYPFGTPPAAFTDDLPALRTYDWST